MSDLVPVKRALISVSDKSGLAEFARALHSEFGVELISTGGTAKFLREQGLPVTDVSQITGFPEMMDGRIKTLHPKIHGGLLSLRDNLEHQAAMQKHGIQPIDLVCINLYPFEQTIRKPNVTFEEAIENIDIGGPAMVRSAAKNHRYVLVVTSPDRYEKVLGDLRQHAGSSCGKHRLKQAQKAFAHTAEYDKLIAEYLSNQLESPTDAKWKTGGGPARFSSEPFGGEVGLATDEFPEPAQGAEAKRSFINRFAERVKSILAFGDGSINSYLNDVATTQAVAVGGTEAAMFLTAASEDDAGSLQPVVHIRPDKASQEIRDQAMAAFREIVIPCLLQRKDGAIEVGGSKQGEGAQFCLVALLRVNEHVVGASAIIARFNGTEEAKQGLASIQKVAGHFSLHASNLKGWTALARSSLPEKIDLVLRKRQDLRYGENPHQKGALYVDRQPTEASVAYAKQLHGKELSYINLLDADGALSCVKEFTQPAACIVKHTTPCGCGVGTDIATAFKKAFDGDPIAAFGGIVAINRTVDLPAAEAITSIKVFLEVIVAPSFDADALELISNRWKNVRLLEVGPITTKDPAELHMHKIVGGYLVQERDLLGLDVDNWKIVSNRKPTAAEFADLSFAWLVCKHVKSNAIVVAKDGMLVGAGAGQMDRPSAARLALAKAGDRAKGAVGGSDAFFPFPDAPELLLSAGVTAIIQPGGSVKDQETIDLVNRHGAAMVMAGQRHFKH